MKLNKIIKIILIIIITIFLSIFILYKLFVFSANIALKSDKNYIIVKDSKMIICGKFPFLVDKCIIYNYEIDHAIIKNLNREEISKFDFVFKAINARHAIYIPFFIFQLKKNKIYYQNIEKYYNMINIVIQGAINNYQDMTCKINNYDSLIECINKTKNNFL